jgi:hypothetical protein
VLGHWGEMPLFWLDRADSLSRIVNAFLEHFSSDADRKFSSANATARYGLDI